MKEIHFLNRNVFWENSCISERVSYSFQTFAILFCTPENLLVGISGALGLKQKATFPAKYMFWENAVEYLRKTDCYSFQTFAIVFCSPENLLVGISGALGMKESHFLS